jgi:hypothetical protein
LRYRRTEAEKDNAETLSALRSAEGGRPGAGKGKRFNTESAEREKRGI